MQTEPARAGRAWAMPPHERFSNRGRFGPGPPDARRFIGRAELLGACALPRAGQVVSCAAGDEAPRPRLETAAPPRAFAGRGVLLDFCRAARRPFLPPEAALMASDLDACAERLGVTVESGDLLLVRTGMLGRMRREGRLDRYVRAPGPGLAPACARWLYDRQIAGLATDTPWVEVCRDSAAFARPLRHVAVTATGLAWGTHFDLDGLAEACAADGNHAFLLTVPAVDDAGETRPLALR